MLFFILFNCPETEMLSHPVRLKLKLWQKSKTISKKKEVHNQMCLQGGGLTPDIHLIMTVVSAVSVLAVILLIPIWAFTIYDWEKGQTVLCNIHP